MNKQTSLSWSLKHALLTLTIAPWAAACEPYTDQPQTGTPGASADYDCSATKGKILLFDTVDEVKAALTNKWGYCSGEPANFKEPREFTADGHWYTLTRAADGQLVRQGGFAVSGTYEIITSGPGPWTYARIIFHNDSYGSTLETELAFLDLPRAMQNGPGIYVPLR